MLTKHAVHHRHNVLITEDEILANPMNHPMNLKIMRGICGEEFSPSALMNRNPLCPKCVELGLALTVLKDATE